MPRSLLQQGMRDLLDAVRLLHSRTDKAITDAMEALRTGDLTMARAVVEGDSEINQERYAIEERCIDLMARQAPVASDLREFISIMSIVTDLERIADHAEGIGRIVLFLRDDPRAGSEPALWEMAEKVQVMLRGAVAAFLDRDEAQARAICEQDDAVDTLYSAIHRRLTQRLAGVPYDAYEFDAMTHVLWCSHNLERIGDRATNICERAIFLVTGKLEEINVSRY